jgi:hypothetical protein
MSVVVVMQAFYVLFNVPASHFMKIAKRFEAFFENFQGWCKMLSDLIG